VFGGVAADDNSRCARLSPLIIESLQWLLRLV